MSSESIDPPESTGAAVPGDQSPVAPALPAWLLEQWPVIAVGAFAWLVTTVLAFAVPALESWRPVSIAGLAVGILGTTIFRWQRSAAQRGSRGAQTGLTTPNNRNEM